MKKNWCIWLSLNLIACGKKQDNAETEVEDSAVELEEDYSIYCNEDPAQNLIEDDQDCDGTPTEYDCDDTDPSLRSILSDEDCDGTRFGYDCDDNDPNSTVLMEDQDCDGVLTADDCDDTNVNLFAQADDGDCDGVLTIDDCDDNDPNSMITAMDGDCDGIFTTLDCDDTDPLIDSSCEITGFVAKPGGCYQFETWGRWHGDRLKLYEDGVYTKTLTSRVTEFCLQATTSSFELQYFSGSLSDQSDPSSRNWFTFTLYDSDGELMGKGRSRRHGFLYFDGGFYSNGDTLQAYSGQGYNCDPSIDGDCDEIPTADDCDDNNASIGSATTVIGQLAEIDTNLDGDWENLELWIRDEWGRPYSYQFWNGNFTYSEIWSYDIDGHLISYEIDEDGSGSPNWGEYREYDANGNRLSYEIDLDGDGIIDEGYYASYDVNDNQLSYDEYSEGAIVSSESFTYGANNNLLSIESDRLEFFTYDSNQKLLSWEEDYNVDGVIERGRYFTNDPDGLVQSMDQDSDGDGQIDIFHTYTYDSLGRLSSKQGVDLDGDAYETEIWSYYPNTNQLQQYNIDWNSGALFKHYTYNEQGRETLLHTDIPTGDETYSFHNYDANGNLLSSGCYGGQHCDYSYTYQYDANGNLIDLVRRGDGNAELIYSKEWEYDANNRLLKYQWYSNNLWNSYTEYYFYDVNGNLNFVERYDIYGWPVFNKTVSQQSVSGCP